MDYMTKPLSRGNIRCLAGRFRELFGAEAGRPFPVLSALEKISDVYPGCNYLIVEDDNLPANTMAMCMSNDFGGYTIEIKESVYDNAYNDIGAYRGFICHELCHVFLFEIGNTPIVTREIPPTVIQAYESVEWQAKALCGEAMIPYYESYGKDVAELVQTYHVSWSSAMYRHRFDDDG